MNKRPYSNLGMYDQNTHGRINAEVSKEDYLHIRGVWPSGGVQAIVATLWYQVIQLCNKYGIHNITDQQQLIDLVDNLELVDRRTRGTPSGVMQEAQARNDSRGTTRSNSKNKRVAH